MLEITRTHAMGRDYDIVLDGTPVATWHRRTWKSGGRLEMGGEELDFHAGRWGRAFELVAGDAVRASADREGRSWQLSCGGERYTLERASAFGRRWQLARGGEAVGGLTRTRLARGLTAELAGVPVPVQVFAGLVLLTVWQRQDATAAAAASASS